MIKEMLVVLELIDFENLDNGLIELKLLVKTIDLLLVEIVKLDNMPPITRSDCHCLLTNIADG